MTRLIERRQILASTSALGLLAATGAKAQLLPPMPLAPPKPAAAGDTNWLTPTNDVASTRYAPLDQINASNFNNLEIAWRFKADNFGPTKDTYFNATPLVVKGRLYSTVGTERDLVCLDAATGELLWQYRHDERGRQGARGGSGWGVSYWTDGTNERILYVTRSYQLISVDATTGRTDPNFGDGNEVDLRKDWDHVVDPVRSIVGLHAAPFIMRDVAVVGAASSDTGPGYVRGYDVRTGKR